MKKLWKLFTFLIFAAIFGVAPASAQVPVKISEKIITMQDGNTYHLHTVERKQTLFSIAHAYKVDQQTIIDKNPVLFTNSLKNKQTLIIPTEKTYKALNHPLVTEAAPVVSTPKTTPAPTVGPEITAPHTATIARDEQPIEDIGSSAVNAPEDSVEATVDFLRPLIIAPRGDNAVNITILMPFSSTSGMDENSADFFEGVLLALKEIKDKGANINVKLLSTDANPQKMRSFIQDGELTGSHIIIGPVYPDTFAPVAEWAMQNKTLIISPLTTVETAANPYIIQFPPLSNNKYGQLQTQLQNPLNNVILLKPELQSDDAALAEFQAIMPVATKTLNYTRFTQAGEISNLLERDKNNIILVPAQTVAAEEILSKIAATNAPIKKYEIQTIGTSRWRTLVNMNNSELLFKTTTTYPSSYHADRLNATVSQFYDTYINYYNRLPSLFSMRGYDIVAIMVEALNKWGENTLINLPGEMFQPLQMPYQFKKNPNSYLENTKWVMVKHTPEFNIEIQ